MSEFIQVSTGASYEELREAQERLNATINAKRAEAREEGIQKIVSLVTEFDLTADELNRALTGKGKPGRKAGVKVAKTSTPAAPKYANPADPSQTWTGRGVAPAWIKNVAKEDRGAYLIAPVGNGVEPAPGPVVDTAPEAADEAPAAVETPVEATAPVFGNTVEA